MAILHLLNSDKVSIEAITVDCAGETHCPDGAINATRLLTLAGRGDIPVYYGHQPETTVPYPFPLMIRKGATEMAVPGFTDLPASKKYSDGAPRELERRLVEAGDRGEPLTIIFIGT